ncbi:hypothetical protein Vi05172_g5643 [Venturia inaequalis]|nr:hypothetical protein Vi05172_g5643 [Venturia inaequalis]
MATITTPLDSLFNTDLGLFSPLAGSVPVSADLCLLNILCGSYDVQAVQHDMLRGVAVHDSPFSPTNVTRRLTVNEDGAHCYTQ